MSIARRALLGAAAISATTFAAPLRARAGSRASGPPLVLAGLYDEAIDPARCLVSEKYDGVRAVWDGSTLRHRSGRPVRAPHAFVERLPAEPLDGELWLGRRRFDALSAIVRAERPDEAAWRSIRYMVFELPAAPGPFEDRARRIEDIARRVGWPQLEAAPQTRVADRAALQHRLDEVVAAGGEGLMLHRADALYGAGRGDALTKLKPYRDAEATVIGHRPGKGRLEGAVGALEVETPAGVRFFLGSGLPDALRRHPPRPGTLVTYRYHDLTEAGVPRFASFLRVHDPF